jgi:hypothetical protein
MAKAAAISALSNQEPSGLVDLISPYLTNKSRPVVRASVVALLDLGRKGHAAIRKNAPTVVKRIGSDRPSRTAFTRMMSVLGVGKMKPVHEYFAKRIRQFESEIRNWQRRTTSGSYGYYWQRRERRAKQRLTEFLRLTNDYIKPPLEKELVDALQSVTTTNSDPMSAIGSLGERMLTHDSPRKKRKERNKSV